MKLTIPGEFPSLNQYIDAERSCWQAAATMKKNCTDSVAWLASTKKPIETYPVRVSFHWYVKNRKIDLDGIAGFGTKALLDGMTKGGLIAGDSLKYVQGLVHTVSVDKENPRVEITLEGMEDELDH